MGKYTDFGTPASNYEQTTASVNTYTNMRTY